MNFAAHLTDKVFENGKRGVEIIVSIHNNDGDLLTTLVYDEIPGGDDTKEFGGWDTTKPMFDRHMTEAIHWARENFEVGPLFRV